MLDLTAPKSADTQSLAFFFFFPNKRKRKSPDGKKTCCGICHHPLPASTPLMRGPRTPNLTMFHYLPKNLPWSQVAQESQTQMLAEAVGGIKE